MHVILFLLSLSVSADVAARVAGLPGLPGLVLLGAERHSKLIPPTGNDFHFPVRFERDSGWTVRTSPSLTDRTLWSD